MPKVDVRVPLGDPARWRRVGVVTIEALGPCACVRSKLIRLCLHGIEVEPSHGWTLQQRVGNHRGHSHSFNTTEPRELRLLTGLGKQQGLRLHVNAAAQRGEAGRHFLSVRVVGGRGGGHVQHTRTHGHT